MYFLPIKMIIDDLHVSTTVVLFIIVPLFYFIYYRKFRYFIFDQRDKVTKGKTSRGKCPPFFPNGKLYKKRLIIINCTCMHAPTPIDQYVNMIEYHLFNIMIDRKKRNLLKITSHKKVV
jgi:hypothetical protein